ncbi:preprotein translocase subunit YajC [Sandarakinorhabdus oryzae]|uniref:preprotein translocase subunit YajC n=1 Tax=Sandarakinorhabdus oryzae TaxID=2675220 RepID=UPI0012E21E5F|nr:preprotein translocase subunit YajC [Sandarakinorhabdus oryzae]
MFETPAYAQAAGGAAAAGGTVALIGFLPYLAIFAIFYFLIIRPQQQRAKQHRAMVDAVKKGDDLVTAGGIIGKAIRVTDTEVEVEAGPNVRFTVLKSTLADVKPRGVPAAANDKNA